MTTVPDDLSPLDRILARSARAPRRILFPDADDPVMIDALARLVSENIVVPCVRASHVCGELPGGVCLLDPGAGEDGSTLPVDGELIRAATPVEESLPRFHLLELATPTESGETVLAFACGGRTATPARLAAVARATADQFRKLCETEPRVALLSFSTHGSARHPAVDTVRAAVEDLLGEKPGFAVGGELQGDAALVPAVAASKAPGDPVAGRANVLVFPDDDSAEIGRALVERLGGGRAAGPFTAGTARPVNSLSRDASAEAIVLAAAVTALQAG